MVGVARGHQRADTLKSYSQKTSQSNHTRTSALSNSMKLSHACGATQDGRVMVERSDRMWSTGEGMANHFSILALRTPWTVWITHEYIIRNAGLEETQAGIKIAGRNINHFRYTDDTTLMAESEEELKCFCWRWKRRVKKLAWNSTLKNLRSLHLVPSLHGR